LTVDMSWVVCHSQLSLRNMVQSFDPLPPLPSPELIEKLETNETSDFFLFKILRAHILPLTNCAFNKSGKGTRVRVCVMGLVM